MSNNLETIVHQLHQYGMHQMPQDLWSSAVPVALFTVLVGGLVSVLGAKVARSGITVIFVGLGGWLGGLFAENAGLPLAPCMGVAAAMAGTVGWLTHRLWVGVGAALVLTAIVMSLFAANRVVPHASTYNAQEQERMLAVAPVGEEAIEVSLATPGNWEQPQQAGADWLRSFWSYVQQQDAAVPRLARALVLGAMLVGLFAGVLAVRFTMIVTSAFIGTLLVASGLMTVITRIKPEFVEGAARHPGIVGMALGSLLVSSLIIQTLITRRAAKAKAEGEGEAEKA